MYVIEGYKHQEIADQLGIDVNTSKSQLSRARKYLQRVLATPIRPSEVEPCTPESPDTDMSTPNSPDARDAAFDEKVRSVLQDRVVEAPAPAPHLFAEAAAGPMARRSLLAASVVLTAAATWFRSPEGTEATGPEPTEAPALEVPAERVELELVEQTAEPQDAPVEVATEGEEAPAVEEVVEVVEVVEAVEASSSSQ